MGEPSGSNCGATWLKQSQGAYSQRRLQQDIITKDSRAGHADAARTNSLDIGAMLLDALDSFDDSPQEIVCPPVNIPVIPMSSSAFSFHDVSLANFNVSAFKQWLAVPHLSGSELLTGARPTAAAADDSDKGHSPASSVRAFIPSMSNESAERGDVVTKPFVIEPINRYRSGESCSSESPSNPPAAFGNVSSGWVHMVVQVAIWW